MMEQIRESKKRESGIEILGEIPWGTHFCLFYQNEQDLLDVLVPYFKEGLMNNEYCMWVTSEPLNEIDAETAIREAIPDFDRYLKKNQIEIIPYSKWYLDDNREFYFESVLNGWVQRLEHALERGFDGLRATGNTAWLEQKDWQSFTNYEEEVNNVIPSYKMAAICTYLLDKCGPHEILDVVRNHQFAVIRKEGSWEIFKSSEQIKVEQELKELNKSLDQKVIQKTRELRESEEKYREAYNRAEFYKDIFAHDINNILQNFKSATDLIEMLKIG